MAGGGGDTAVGGVGIGAVRDGTGFVSLGTSGQVFLAASAYRPEPARMVHAFCHALPGLWYAMAALLNGASPLAAVARWTGRADVGALIGEVEAAHAGPSRLLALPYLFGERTPHNDPAARGAIIGLTGSTGPVEIAQAMMEAVAFSLRDGLDALCPAGVAARGSGLHRGWLALAFLGPHRGLSARRHAGALRGRRARPGLRRRPARLPRRHGRGFGRRGGPSAIADVIAPDPVWRDLYAPRLTAFRSLYAALKTLRRTPHRDGRRSHEGGNPMNKLGVHALVWAAGWSHDEAAYAIGQSAELGYDLIEIAALDPSAVDVDFTRRALEKAGIGATCSLGLDAATDISSGDPDKTKAGQARLEQAIAMARDIGATHVCGILHSAFQKYAIPTTAEGVKRSVEVLQRVAETAARSDIVLGLEVVNRYETNVLNTASQGVEMCRRIGAPNVKVHLDVYHMNIEESDIASAIIETGEHLGYFHTGDSHRGYMGSGTIDLAGVFRALVKADYKGPITFESFSSRVVGQPLEGILGIWRNLWEDGRDLAAHAKMYTDAQLKSAREAQRQAERSRLV